MRKLFALGVVIALVFLCVQLVQGTLFSTIFNRPTQGEEVAMLQPNGIFLHRDQQASEINVNNSQANQNNGEYYESLAIATLTVAQAETTKEAYTTNGFFLGGIGGILIGGICVFGFILLVFALFVGIASRSSNSSSDIIEM